MKFTKRDMEWAVWALDHYEDYEREDEDQKEMEQSVIKFHKLLEKVKQLDGDFEIELKKIEK